MDVFLYPSHAYVKDSSVWRQPVQYKNNSAWNSWARRAAESQ